MKNNELHEEMFYFACPYNWKRKDSLIKFLIGKKRKHILCILYVNSCDSYFCHRDESAVP